MITIQINFKKIKKKSRCARARVCVCMCVWRLVVNYISEILTCYIESKSTDLFQIKNLL